MIDPEVQTLATVTAAKIVETVARDGDTAETRNRCAQYIVMAMLDAQAKALSETSRKILAHIEPPVKLNA